MGKYGSEFSRFLEFPFRSSTQTSPALVFTDNISSSRDLPDKQYSSTVTLSDNNVRQLHIATDVASVLRSAMVLIATKCIE